MNVSKLQEIIEDAGYPCRSYSGRGVYKECLGVVCKNVFHLFSDICDSLRGNDQEELANCLNECAKAFKNALGDSMGMDRIVYFPEYECVDEFAIDK